MTSQRDLGASVYSRVGATAPRVLGVSSNDEAGGERIAPPKRVMGDVAGSYLKGKGRICLSRQD